jgi:hypothetical protein
MDADEKPLPGVDVEAAGRRARTDEEGRFVLEGLPPGPDRIAVRFQPAPACRAFEADAHLPHVERKAPVGGDLRVRLARAARLRLRLDPQDRRLARATLHLAAGEVRLRRRIPRGGGEIEVEDLPEGPVAVEVAAPGLLGTGGAVVQARRDPGEAVVVALRPGRSVRGTVALRRTVARPGTVPLFADTPLDRGWVTLLDGDPARTLATTPVAADGSFLLEGLPPAPVLLAAAAPGLPAAVVRVDLRGGDAESVAFLLEPPAEAAIVVTGEGGAPLAQARVRLVTEHGVDVRDLAARGRFLDVVASDADVPDVAPCFRLVRRPAGRVAAPFLQPGSYRFLVSAEGYREQRIGVRARDPAALAALRGLGWLPDDWASPVRLERDPSGEAGD